MELITNVSGLLKAINYTIRVIASDFKTVRMLRIYLSR